MSSVEIGDSLLAHRFYAGQYREIVADTVDAGEPPSERDLAFVVGALCFVDRVDEARALVDRFATIRDPRTVAASRFFLGLAAARAGYFDRARPLLVGEALRDRHDADPWVRAVVFQGLACYWYFTGRFPGAAAHAMRALQAAHEAGFLYVAMLGTDLRGHALVQLGQLHRGIAMLEQAGKQARRLGLTNNAFAVETSILTYQAQFDPHAEVLEQLEALLRRKAHDSYSHRVLLIAITVQHALRGRRDEALQALEAAESDALRGDTRRGKAASLLARIWVTRFQDGPAACRDLVDQARALVEDRDIPYRAELLSHEIACARASEDLPRVGAAIDELRVLWRASHHFAARAGLVQFDPLHRQVAFDEDARARVLRAVAHRDVTAIPRLVSLGLFGVIPELLGLAPARRILWLPANELLLLEDHGNLVARARPPRWCPPLLQLLSSPASKPEIARALWGIRTYHPDLHDPPVRTTIHRLRSFLADHASWIVVEEGSYRSVAPLHVVRGDLVDREPAPTAPLWEDIHVPALEVPREPERSQSASPAIDTKQLVLARLEDVPDASVPELAKSLERSASTVLRALRDLVDERRVERKGFARATRYQLR